MNDVKIDNINAVLEPKALGLLFQTVTRYVQHSSIKIPSNLKVYVKKLKSDSYGTLSIAGESQVGAIISASLMGTLIDYLNRIMNCSDLKAFDFLILGLSGYPEFTKDDLKRLSFLIKKIKQNFTNKRIDDLTTEDVSLVISLCKYEEFYRSGIRPVSFQLNVNETALEHIKIMMHRCKNFFNICGYPKIIDYQSSFGGNSNITSLKDCLGKKLSSLRTIVFGDGDYLLRDAIIDFKVSTSPTMQSLWKKQLIVYYLGLNEDYFKDENTFLNDKIKYLAVFNPRNDTVYILNLFDLKYKQLFKFYQQLTADIERDTTEAQNVVRKMLVNLKTRSLATKEQAEYFVNPFKKYPDGIHQIIRFEYQRYCKSVLKVKKDVYCNYPGMLYLIKREGFYAVFIKSKTGLSLLNKGQRSKTKHDLNYYYENIAEYGKRIKTAFSGYQNALNEISREVQSFGGKGRNHGSIVDIDFYDHIYLDPITHELKYYSAETIGGRTTYPTVGRLLEKTPYSLVFGNDGEDLISHEQMLAKYKENKAKGDLQLIDRTATLELPSSSGKMVQIISNDFKNHEESYEFGYNQKMYSRSRIMLKIQLLLKHNTVTYWSDSVLKSTSFENDNLHFKNSMEIDNDIENISLLPKPIKDILAIPEDLDNKYAIRLKYKKISDSIKVKKFGKRKLILGNYSESKLHLFRQLTDYVIKDYAKEDKLNKEYWNSKLKQIRLKNKLSDKDIQALNNILLRSYDLIDKYDAIQKVAQDTGAGFIDLQLEKANIVIDLIDSKNVSKKMMKTISAMKKLDKERIAAIYNVSLDVLYVAK